MFLSKATRRSFLAASCVGAAASFSTKQGDAARAAPSFSLGIQMFSLRGYPVDEALQHAKDLGFSHVEFYPKMFSVNSDAAAIHDMNNKIKGLGLTVSAHGVNRLTKDADANRKLFEFAQAAGIQTITADPDPESFDNLDELVKEFNIRIAIHNHGPRHRYNKVVDVLGAIEKHDERIGACADLGHYIRSGERPVEVIRLLKGRLYGIHLKDFAEMKDKAEGVILGQGFIDAPAVMTALVQVGFPKDGALSIEYEKNRENPLNDIRECVRVMKEAMAQV